MSTDLPRPIESTEIRDGDTVRSERVEHGVKRITEFTVRRFSINGRSVLVEGGGDLLWVEHAADTWTLLARAEPEPLVPTEPTFGALTLVAGHSITAIFRIDPDDGEVMAVDSDGDRYDGWWTPDVQSFTPLTIQPEGTTAVPEDVLERFRLAVIDRHMPGGRGRVVDSAVLFIKTIDAAGDQS